MIRSDESASYFVFPSWAQFSFKWEDLDRIFRNPFGSGYLDRPEYYSKIGYQPGVDEFQLIKGPVGNGIIKEIGGFRYLWAAVLLRKADFSILPGFPGLGPNYGVHWLEEKRTDEHHLGLRKRQPVFLPLISLDYAEEAGRNVYLSLAFGIKKGDEEACLRFQMRCEIFGLKCLPVSTLDALPETARCLTSPAVQNYWLRLENVLDDIGLLVSKLFYLACATKQESKAFKMIHLIGAFEGKPVMAQGWKEYRSNQPTSLKTQS